MANVTRRYFLLSSAALSVGCTMRRPDAAQPVASSPTVRPPAVGQSWRYAKHDIYTHTLVDDEIDRVAAVGRTIDIDSSSEAAKGRKADASWGTALLRKYIPRRELPEGPFAERDPSTVGAGFGGPALGSGAGL
jgi:hypothetical protein